MGLVELPQWLTDLLQSLQDQPFAIAIGESPSLFPWIESVHVLAITAVLGSIAVIDMQLLGLTSHRRSVRTLMADVLPLTWVGFAIAVVSGALLFSSNAVRYAGLPSFQAKGVLMALAGLNMLVFHLFVERSIDASGERPPPPAARFAGGASLTLWIGVTIAGRLIGFE